MAACPDSDRNGDQKWCCYSKYQKVLKLLWTQVMGQGWKALKCTAEEAKMVIKGLLKAVLGRTHNGQKSCGEGFRLLEETDCW